MFKSDRAIALDIGASKITLAEFSTSRPGRLELLNYGVGRLGADPDQSVDASAYVVSTIRELMRENGIRPAPMLMSISGQAVFPRFVKLPAVTRDKVMQIVQYEAEQNVPFPIEEVVWDYQLLESDGGELNVILVAVKRENVTRLTDCVLAAGMEPEVVDVAPMALYNTVRYNYAEIPGCAIVLEIGARASNLVFIEGPRVFSRSIPVAGNVITQEVAKEFDMSFEEAEDLKRAHGFVAFGGVYAGPDSEVADRVSKIVRNVITRLHAEVNRSINFYRSQHGGSAPSVVLLTGGSSVIPHMDTFFQEKLKVDVEYLNPFVNVAVSPGIDRERLDRDTPLLGEVTGLGLRRVLSCPVEINLMPPALVARKLFRRRQPFFALSAVGLALIMLCWSVYTRRMRAMLQTRVQSVQVRIDALDEVNRRLQAVVARKQDAETRLVEIVDIVALRAQWLQMLDAVRQCLSDGVWLTSLKPVTGRSGMIEQVEVSGIGFEDKLKPLDRPEATAIESLRDRLRASEHFTKETSITRVGVSSSSAFVREFTIRVSLRKPMKVT